jgi:acyl carrier protein
MSSCHYNVTREQVEKLIRLKHELDDIVEDIMMTQAMKTCPYKECPKEQKVVLTTISHEEEIAFAYFAADKLGIDSDKIELDLRFTEDLGADSLDRVELVMAAEDRYGIEITDEDAEKLQTVRDAINYLKSRNVSLKLAENVTIKSTKS